MCETICFVIRDKTSAITVCDLSHACSYERTDWDLVNDEIFDTPAEACKYARALAKKYGVEYKPFENRYGDPYVDVAESEGEPGVMYLTEEEMKGL